MRTENSFPSVSGWYKKFACGTGSGHGLAAGGGGCWYTATNEHDEPGHGLIIK